MSIKGRSFVFLLLCLFLAGCGGTGSEPADEPAVTPKAGKAGKCRPASSYAYVETVVCHLKLAASHNKRIENKCSQYVEPPCKAEILSYQSQLKSAREHLTKVKAPPFLRKADRKLRRAINHDIRASDKALKAIEDVHQSAFLSAWGEHGQAGRALNSAGHSASRAWARLWR